MALLRALVLLLVLTPAAAASAAPNILVIMTDDQEDTGSMAYMPKVRSLIAEQGITFQNSFANVPLCAPSRASFFTGQAAHNHGIKANSPLDDGGWEAFKAKEETALPVWLQQAGYKTALLGKYINRYGQQSHWGAWLAWLGNMFGIEFKGETIGNPRDWVPKGWDLWYAFTGSRVRYYDYAINENGTILDFGDKPEDYSTDVLSARAVRFILDQKDTTQPFFLYIAPKAAHAEGKRAIPAPRHAQSFKDVSLPMRAAFDEKDVSRKAIKAPRVKRPGLDELTGRYHAELQSLQAVDELVEAVVEALKSAGKLDNTVLVYTSDNGFLFGEHRLIGKTAAYDESIKVPLAISGPGVAKNETRSQLVNTLDVVATIADLAGAKPNQELDGSSLKPLFADSNAPWRGALLLESPVTRFERVQNRYLGVRTSTQKYIRYEGGFEELFDLAADPDEIKNQAGNPLYASDLGALRDLLEKLKTCAGSNCWVPGPSAAARY